MNEKELQTMIEQVVREVLAGRQAEEAADDGRPKALVIGEREKAPKQLTDGFVVCPLSEYENSGNILRYKRVIITELTLLELSDISLGRPGSPAACAVLQALLNGIETALLESGLPYKKYSGRCSTKLYAVLENNVKTLQSFGVKTYTAERLKDREPEPGRPARFARKEIPTPRGSAQPNPEKLITEEKARQMLPGCSGSVHLPSGAILTPSARDVFQRAKIEIVKDL